MAKKSVKDQNVEFQCIADKLDALIKKVEEVLEDSLVEGPNPSHLRKNQDITLAWILNTQVILADVCNMHTTLMIEDRRLWEFGEILKRENGVMKVEALTKRVNFYLKSLRDLSYIFKERKSDLTQIITSVRSVQSAITERFRAASGG